MSQLKFFKLLSTCAVLVQNSTQQPTVTAMVKKKPPLWGGEAQELGSCPLVKIDFSNRKLPKVIMGAVSMCPIPGYCTNHCEIGERSK